MRRLVLMGVLALSLFFITGLVYAEERLSYVNVERILKEYNKAKEYDKVLENKQKDYEQKRQKELDEIRKLQDKLSLLSEEEREARKGELEDKIAQLQEFDRSSSQDFRKQRDERVQEIFKDVNEAIESYASGEGITLVFDQRALIYVNRGLDITEQVLKILNKR